MNRHLPTTKKMILCSALRAMMTLTEEMPIMVSPMAMAEVTQMTTSMILME